MAHPQQLAYFERIRDLFATAFSGAENILEVGSQNINGTVRDFFAADLNYLGIDLGRGEDVDLVIPGELVELPDGWADIAISTECFEHAENWRDILLNMIRITKPEGLILLTFAGKGRTTHGTLDSDVFSSPFTTTYYHNLGPDDVARDIALGKYFSRHGFEVDSIAHDTYFWGIRNCENPADPDSDWETLERRLVRAQGQLGQAVNLYNELRLDLKKSQSAYEQLSHELADAQAKLKTSLEHVDVTCSKQTNASFEAQQPQSTAAEALAQKDQARREAIELPKVLSEERKQTAIRLRAADLERLAIEQEFAQALTTLEKVRQQAASSRQDAEIARQQSHENWLITMEIVNSRIWRGTQSIRNIKDGLRQRLRSRLNVLMHVSTYLRKAGRKSRQLSKRWVYPLSPRIHSFLFFELRRKLVTLTSALATESFSDFSRLLHKKDQVGNFLPLVTIIVPSFNHGKYLRQRLDSIYQQTYSNYEVILLDDHSTDESAQILNEFASNHRRNTFLEINSTNSRSPFKQWSKGLQQAKGELIWIAESDDFCDPNFLAELVPAFINEAVMLAFSQIRFTNQEGDTDVWSMEEYLPEFGPQAWQSPFTVSAHKLVQKAWNRRNIIPNASAALFRRHHHLDLLGNNEWLHMRVCGDWLFYLFVARGGLVHYSPKTTNYYRQHFHNSSVAMHQQMQYLDEHISAAQSLVCLYRLDASDVKKMQVELAQRWRQHHGEAIPAEQQRKIDCLQSMCTARKPNTLIVTYSLIPGGGEILPLKLANILHSKGYAITVLNCHQYPNNIGIRAMLRPGIPLIELQSLEDLPKLVEELGIEVIHSHHPWVDTTLSELLADNPHLAHAITSHGMYDEIDRDDFARIGKLLTPWVRKVSYVADKNKQPLLDLGFDESQLRKISNAIDSMEIEPIERASLGISEPDAFVVCLVSRAKREKGWQEAIEAIAMAQKQTDRPIHLLLAGEGVELQRLQRITTDVRVHFLGFHSQPRNLYATSDLGILPTFYPGESQPLTLIECLAAGKPLIASDIGEIASMLTISEGIAGAVIPLWEGRVDPSAFADQILIHAENPDIHHQRCEMAKLASEKFNPDVMATEYADLYEDAIKSCGSPIYGNKSRHYGD